MFFKKITAIIIALVIALSGNFVLASSDAQITAADLKTEYLTNPISVSIANKPRFSWEVSSAINNQLQTAYRIVVNNEAGTLVWDSGKVLSNETIGIECGGNLDYGSRYTWKVCLWDGSDNQSDWSEEAAFETEISPDEWESTNWIGAPESADSSLDITDANWIWATDSTLSSGKDAGYRYFRIPVTPDKSRELTRVLLAYTADNYASLFINGETVNQQTSDSRWFTNGKLFDITKYFSDGNDALIAFEAYDSGDGGALIFKIRLEYSNGTYTDIKSDSSQTCCVSQTQRTDEAWKTASYSENDFTTAVTKVKPFDSSPWNTASKWNGGNIPFTYTNLSSEEETVSGDIVDGTPYLRKEFTAQDKEIEKARVYITGLGSYILYLNGARVGDNCIDPIITQYDDRYFYVTYDVRDKLLQGDVNAVGVELGHGRYAAQAGTADCWQHSGFAGRSWSATDNQRPCLRMIMRIWYEDGTSENIVTDTSWKTTDSPRLFDEFMYGEVYDSRKEKDGWTTASYDDTLWLGAEELHGPDADADGEPAVVPQTANASKVVENITAVKLVATHLNMKLDDDLNIVPAEENDTDTFNTYIFDMGRQVTGWARLDNISAASGTEITIRYDERAAKNYGFDRNKWFKADDSSTGCHWNTVNGAIRERMADYYVSNGNSAQSFEAAFVYKGFRYVSVSVPTSDSYVPKASDITGKVVNSALERVSEFESSSSALNTIHKLSYNTLLNNMHGFISDTPVYEDLGYLGDAALTQEMGLYNFDGAQYYEKWAYDIIDGASDGTAGPLVPAAGGDSGSNLSQPVWCGAICTAPWYNYIITGNKRVLTDAYPYMTATVDKYLAVEYDENGMFCGTSDMKKYDYRRMDEQSVSNNWGDHKGVNEGGENGRIAAITNTCWVYYMTDITAKTALITGNSTDYEKYTQKAQELKEEFNSLFYDSELGYYHMGAKNSTYNTGKIFKQTAQVLPLQFGMVPGEFIPTVQKNLTERTKTESPDTGMVGLKWLYPMLSELGCSDYALKDITSLSRFGIFLALGDTSLRENFADGARSSDHHMFGAVDDWFYKSILGINNDGVAFDKIAIKPHAADSLTYAKGHLDTVRGKISSAWTLDESGSFTLDIETPGNTTATVYIPASGEVEAPSDAVFVKDENGCKVYTVGSGKYRFKSTYPVSASDTDIYDDTLIFNTDFSKGASGWKLEYGSGMNSTHAAANSDNGYFEITNLQDFESTNGNSLRPAYPKEFYVKKGARYKITFDFMYTLKDGADIPSSIRLYDMGFWHTSSSGSDYSTWGCGLTELSTDSSGNKVNPGEWVTHTIETYATASEGTASKFGFRTGGNSSFSPPLPDSVATLCFDNFKAEEINTSLVSLNTCPETVSGTSADFELTYNAQLTSIPEITSSVTDTIINVSTEDNRSFTVSLTGLKELTGYTLTVSDVTDIYGGTLTSEVINFSTEKNYAGISMPDISNGYFSGGTAAENTEEYYAAMSHNTRAMRNTNNSLDTQTSWYVAAVQIKATGSNSKSAYLNVGNSGDTNTAGYTLVQKKLTVPLAKDEYTEVPTAFCMTSPGVDSETIPQVHLDPYVQMNDTSASETVYFKDFVIRKLIPLDCDGTVMGTAVRSGSSAKLYLYSPAEKNIYYLASDGQDIRLESKTLKANEISVIELENISDNHKLFVWDFNFVPLNTSFMYNDLRQ